MDNFKRGKPGRGLLVFILVLEIVSVCAFLPGCSPKISREIRTEIQYRERLVPITASVNIPYYVERNVTRDTTSHLENPYAKSDAVVSDGFLYHTLESIPQTIMTEVLVPVTDTLWKESEIITKEVPVEKKLSWWQKFRIDSFWWLLGGLILSLLWIFRKYWLPILKTLVKI